jgi:hypothetical protein
VSIRQRIERGAEAIITVAASLPVFALVTLLCAGWLSGAIETSGVFQPSGLDGIITFWHIDGVPDDLAGIEKDVERLRATRDA